MNNKRPFIVTYAVGQCIVLGVNDTQVHAFCELRFGKGFRYLISLATDVQFEFMQKQKNAVYITCIDGGKK
jgi:hypothetical protein